MAVMRDQRAYVFASAVWSRSSAACRSPVSRYAAPNSAGPRQGVEAKANPQRGAGASAKSEHHSRGYANVADRIARERGTDVILILRRTTPPYDYKYVRGYASR